MRTGFRTGTGAGGSGRGVPSSQILRLLGAGHAERLRANLSPRLAALGSTLTCSMWVRLEDFVAALRPLAGFWRFNPGGGVNLGWLFSVNNGGFPEFRWTTDGTTGTQVIITGDASLSSVVGSPSTWFNIGVSFDSTNLFFTVNGSQLGSTFVTGSSPFIGIADWSIGADDDNVNRWASVIGPCSFYDVKKPLSWHEANFNVLQDEVNPDPDRVCSYTWVGNEEDANGTGQDLTLVGISRTNFPPVIIT